MPFNISDVLDGTIDMNSFSSNNPNNSAELVKEGIDNLSEEFYTQPWTEEETKNLVKFLLEGQSVNIFTIWSKLGTFQAWENTITMHGIKVNLSFGQYFAGLVDAASDTNVANWLSQ